MAKIEKSQQQGNIIAMAIALFLVFVLILIYLI